MLQPDRTVRPWTAIFPGTGATPGTTATRRHGGPAFRTASGAGRRPGLSGPAPAPSLRPVGVGRRHHRGSVRRHGSDRAWPRGGGRRAAARPAGLVFGPGAGIPRLSGGCRLGPVRPAPVDEDPRRHRPSAGELRPAQGPRDRGLRARDAPRHRIAGRPELRLHPSAILVPFASPYAAIWVGIGQLTFYGLAVVTVSFYVRRQIGQRAWRLLHYLTFLVFIGAIGHGVMAGSDAGAAWAFWLYLVPGAAAVFLLVYRIVVSVSGRISASESERPVAVSPLIARSPLPLPGGRVPSGRPAAPLQPPPPGLSVRRNVRNRSAAPGGLRWPT